jgi:hypothetical protein
LLLVVQTSGCAIKLVADYDARIAQENINISRQVDKFYGQLLETAYSDRSYDAFKDRYIEIEVNIRALVVQNKARPLNDESISISETILEKWIKYKDTHKENWARYQLPDGDENKIEAKDIYKDVLIGNHRKRFTRLFTAMSVAEEAKKMKSEEAETEGEGR